MVPVGEAERDKGVFFILIHAFKKLSMLMRFLLEDLDLMSENTEIWE